MRPLGASPEMDIELAPLEPSPSGQYQLVAHVTADKFAELATWAAAERPKRAAEAAIVDWLVGYFHDKTDIDLCRDEMAMQPLF